ncbi:unnamed protein product, partial [Closterium sp. NIES-54]
MAAAKRVLRYLCSTSGMGLVLGGQSPVVLTGHADASWGDDQATQQSSQGYTFSLGSGSVSWRATCSSFVLGSSCEAEICAGAMAAQELRWLTYLLTDLGEPPRSPPVLYVDNKAMLALCREQRLEHRTKHIALRYFLARQLQQRGQLRLAYVASEANTADVFTKALAPCDHQRFCTQLVCWTRISRARLIRVSRAPRSAASGAMASPPSQEATSHGQDERLQLPRPHLTFTAHASPHPRASRAVSSRQPAKLVPPVFPGAALRARLIPATMASAAFPALSSTVAPAPSALWSANLTAPYPTNAPWQNMVLGQGGNPELVTPYLVQSAEGRIAWGLPVRDPQPGYIVQAFVTALMLSTLQGLPPHQLSAYDDLSATLSFRQPSSAPADPSILEVPLVRGSPFLTFIFPPGGPPATPVLTTIHAITGVEASSDSSKYHVALNNGQTWLVYLSSPLTLRQDGSTLAADVPFTGTMRVALLPGSSPQDEEALLDAHVPTVPVGGSAQVGAFRIKYTWRTQQWREPANGDTEAPLLMLSLPMHRRMEVSAHSPSSASALHRHRSGSPSGAMGALRGHHNSASARPSITRGNAPWSSVGDESVPDASVLAYPTIDGQAVGMQGAVWRLKVPKRPSTWRAGPLSSDPQLLDELRASLKQDVAALPPLSSPSTYSFGKTAARAARLALIAKQVRDEDSLAAVLPPLRTALSAWLDGTFS